MQTIYLGLVVLIVYLHSQEKPVEAFSENGLIILGVLLVLSESAGWREAFREKHQSENIWSYLKAGRESRK